MRRSGVVFGGYTPHVLYILNKIKHCHQHIANLPHIDVDECAAGQLMFCCNEQFIYSSESTFREGHTQMRD